MTTTELDWRNKPAPAEENADTSIWVWCVDAGDQTYCVRGWQQMLDTVRSETEAALDGQHPMDCELEVRVWLQAMTKGEYDALQEP